MICWRNYVCARDLPCLLLNVEVLSANLIIALIMSIFGFYLSNGLFFQVPNQPPSKYKVSLYLGPTSWRIFYLKFDHKKQRKWKWSTVSTLFLHMHFVEDAASILPRYQLNLQISICSWHKIAACCFGFPLYKDWVCLKRSGTLSKLFVNLLVLGFVGQASSERGKRTKAVERATTWSSIGRY